MTPLSVVFEPARAVRLLGLAAAVVAISACAGEPVAPANPAPASQPKPVCSAPPPIHDIWKLEPLLVEQGLITSTMSREQKEAAIRDYIRKKNQTFLNNCQEKK